MNVESVDERFPRVNRINNEIRASPATFLISKPGYLFLDIRFKSTKNIVDVIADDQMTMKLQHAKQYGRNKIGRSIS